MTVSIGMTMGSPFTVDDLIGIAPPPEWRVDAGSPEQWEEVERALGTVLPGDYKVIINTYGTGEFNDLFAMFNPFSSSEGMNLLWQAGIPDCLVEDEELGRVYPLGSDLENYQLSRIDYPELCPFPPYPEPGGLLPLGGDTNGGSAYWLTEGRPDDWPLIFFPHGLRPIERHPMPLLEFLALWLSGQLPECFDGAGKHFVNRTDPVFRPA
jgi:hypothetical protein